MFNEANRRIIEAEVPQIASRISRNTENQNHNTQKINAEANSIFTEEKRLVLNTNYIKNPEINSPNPRISGIGLPQINSRKANLSGHFKTKNLLKPQSASTRILYTAGLILTLGLLPYILRFRFSNK